jgi:hypothetical protein
VVVVLERIALNESTLTRDVRLQVANPNSLDENVAYVKQGKEIRKKVFK